MNPNQLRDRSPRNTSTASSLPFCIQNSRSTLTPSLHTANQPGNVARAARLILRPFSPQPSQLPCQVTARRPSTTQLELSQPSQSNNHNKSPGHHKSPFLSKIPSQGSPSTPYGLPTQASKGKPQVNNPATSNTPASPTPSTAWPHSYTHYQK